MKMQLVSSNYSHYLLAMCILITSATLTKLFPGAEPQNQQHTKSHFKNYPHHNVWSQSDFPSEGLTYSGNLIEQFMQGEYSEKKGSILGNSKSELQHRDVGFQHLEQTIDDAVLYFSLGQPLTSDTLPQFLVLQTVQNMS